MAAGTNWEKLWSDGQTPWDLKGPHPLLKRWADEGRVPTGRCLVPGCGRGYDVALLASLPGRFAVGLDLAPTGVAAAAEYVRSTGAPESSYRIEAADFFQWAPALADADRFAFVYDYTFFCAIQPSLRRTWGEAMAKAVQPGGLLLCLQFPFRAPRPDRVDGDYATGPPFLVKTEFYDDVLRDAFDLVESGDVPAELSPPTRAGNERYALYRRKQA